MDPIANMLTAIKNALAVNKSIIILSYSKLKENILQKLKQRGFVDDFKTRTKNKKKEIIIKLKYNNNQPAISHLKRISKPGLRIYSGYKQIPRPLSGLGIVYISTPKGIMEGEEARMKKIGGEVLYEIY